MKKKIPIKTEAAWIKNPVMAKLDRLRPMRDVILETYNGQKRKRRIFRTHYLLGSADECDIQIRDPFVCARHAEIHLTDEGYVVTDLGSRNGIFLNGVKIKSAPLPAQGNLRIGRSALTWKEELAEEEQDNEWIVADPFMRATTERLKQIARSPLPVMLLGETGTGKEILARIIHRASPRAAFEYVAVNGALTGGSLSESELFGHKKGAFTGAETPRMGALRMANGGTLFLDEVADIPPSAQVKLLRALEAGEVRPLGSDHPETADFRLVSATSQDLERKVAEGSFRLDLYYRLAGFVVHIPPLRERPLDIMAIAKKTLEPSGLDLGEECEGKLLSYRWPGNVRELRSCIGRAVVIARQEGSPRILADHLVGLDGGVNTERRGKPFTLVEIERDFIRASLERNGWSRGSAARELGIARSTLFEKMKRYEIRDGMSAH